MKYLHSFTTAAYAVLIALSCPPLLSAAHAAELAPPPFSLTDKNDVNILTSQLSLTLEDVSIGGDMGLAHSISTHSSNFGDDFYLGVGLVDKFQGLIKRVNWETSQIQPPRWVWEASDGTENVEFWDNNNGSYTAVRDERYTLTFVSGEGFTMIKPDGTEVAYHRPSAQTPLSLDHGIMTEVRRPNGIIIRITNVNPNVNTRALSSVMINTGFQLKYLYEVNNAGLLYDKPQVIYPPVNTTNWHAIMPKYVVAINNAIEYCDPRAAGQGGTCNLTTLTRPWPKAEYTWPGGMPRAMALYDTVFKVTDAANRITEYHHRPFETQRSIYSGTVQDYDYRSRIVAIKRAQDSEPGIRYDYQNHVVWTSPQQGYFRWSSTDAVLSRSMIGSSEWSYACCNENSMYNEISATGGRPNAGVVSSSTWKKPIKTYVNNFVYHSRDGYKSGVGTAERYSGGVSKTEYKYTRDNITKIIFNGVLKQEAEYPASCSASNRKICNKALWIKDGEGNRTDYTYDSRHGGVLTETGPADPRGIRPQTRYGYSQYYSYTRNSAGARVKSTQPIWLLTTTKLCADSAYVNNVCAANDEIVTTYEYNHDNLFMTGQTVSADGVTKRTCFEYDVYGNRIGVSEPEANLSSCN